MKKATEIIVEKFPSLKEHVNAYENMFTRQQALDSLDDDIERTFIQLVWFFEDPDNNDFDLRNLYNKLENEWLIFALDVISFYFKTDTYLIQNPTESVIYLNDYVDQNGASRYLESKGLAFPQGKIATYILRGKFPKEDLLVAGKKFWKVSTIDKYASEQLEKRRIGATNYYTQCISSISKEWEEI